MAEQGLSHVVAREGSPSADVRKRVLDAILPFSGAETENFIGFLGAIDGCFAVLNIEESEKAPLLLSCLRGYPFELALLWIQQGEVSNHQELREALKRQFEEPSIEFALRKKIKSLKQTGTVSETAFKFQQLSVRITATEVERISLFVDILTPSIREAIFVLTRSPFRKQSRSGSYTIIVR